MRNNHLPYGMSNTDSSSVDIDFTCIKSTFLNVSENHDTKSFIHFKHCNIFFLHSRLVQTFWHCVRRGDGEVNWGTRCISKGCEKRYVYLNLIIYQILNTVKGTGKGHAIPVQIFEEDPHHVWHYSGKMDPNTANTMVYTKDLSKKLRQAPWTPISYRPQSYWLPDTYALNHEGNNSSENTWLTYNSG